MRPLPIPTVTKPEALYAGLVGRVVDVFAPCTEASPVAIAIQFLIAMGNLLGVGPCVYVGETRHGLNENALLVGTTAFSRKGDSLNSALRLLKDADPNWAKNNIASGLSSGEGLIYAVRDQVYSTDKTTGALKVTDAGVTDKRLLITETEFSGALKMFARAGNILSDVTRNAWDGRTLRTLTKHSAMQASAPHISIIGHTTPEDLRTHLTELDIANGFGNRFLFALVNRVRSLPNPPRVDAARLLPVLQEIKDVIVFAQGVTEMRRTPDAEALWEWIYPELTKEQFGLVGKLLARGPAHITRLSALYALLARRPAPKVADIESGLAVWAYSKDSVQILFGDRSGNPIVDRIRHEMLPGQELTLSELRQQLFSNHVSAAGLADALNELKELGEVEVEDRATGGRPVRIVRRVVPSGGAERAQSAERESTASTDPETEHPEDPGGQAEAGTEAAEGDATGSSEMDPPDSADPPTPDAVETGGTSESALARIVTAALYCDACGLGTVDIALVYLCCELNREFTADDALRFLHRHNGGPWKFAVDPGDPWASLGRIIMPLREAS
jgi:hypothetical protein